MPMPIFLNNTFTGQGNRIARRPLVLKKARGSGKHLAIADTYDIIGGGGVIGVVKSKNYALKDVEPTKVRQVAYCCQEDGEVINTKFHISKRVS